MPSFDLLTEPWIPVVTRECREEEVGLRAVLHRAPELREIRDPVPLVEFGLYRLLVALVMDLHGLAEVVDLEELLAAGRFDESKVARYLARWHGRFDLFHPVHPFLQTPGLTDEDERPLAALLPATPSGVQALHFHHRHEDSFRASPAAAARLLTTMAPFMTAGGAGLSPSINGAPPWYVLLRGNSLFETLSLNCCVLPLAQASGDAPPVWRNETAVSEERATGASLLEALTWRPRRVQLLAGEAGRCSLTGEQCDCTVSRMRFARGARGGFAWTDPSVAYRVEADKTTPLRPRQDRALWRDTGALMLLARTDRGGRGCARVCFERSALIDQLAELARGGVLGRRAEVRLTVYGLRTDLKMKVFEWQRESLSLPLPLLWRSALRCEAQQAMEEAESAAEAVREAVRRAFARGGRARRSASGTAAAERRFWHHLRPHYEELLGALAGLADDAGEQAHEGCRRRWRQHLRRLAQQAVDEATGAPTTRAAAIVRQVRARAALRQRLRWLTAARGGVGGGDGYGDDGRCG